MEFKISKIELSKLLLVTQTIAEKKSTMPILGNLLLRAEGSSLSIIACDMELTAVSSCEAQVITPGGIAIAAKVFGEIVREFPDGELTIRRVERNRIELRSGKANMKLIGVPAEEYPIPEALGLTVKSSISAKLLLEMITKTIYAVSLEEGRYTMNGVCIETTEGPEGVVLRMVATDSHRLALIERPVSLLSLSALSNADKNLAGNVNHAIVPRKGLMEIKKLLEVEADGDVGIDIDGGCLVLETRATKLVVRLIEGEYPDYESVFPQLEGTKAIVLSANLVQALKRVALMVSDRNKGVRFTLSDNLLRISSSSPELGEASEDVEVEYSGELLRLGFNARYLIDLLQAVGEAQSIVMEFFGEEGPGKFYTLSDEGYKAIVMPQRIETPVSALAA